MDNFFQIYVIEPVIGALWGLLLPVIMTLVGINIPHSDKSSGGRSGRPEGEVVHPPTIQQVNNEYRSYMYQYNVNHYHNTRVLSEQDAANQGLMLLVGMAMLMVLLSTQFARYAPDIISIAKTSSWLALGCILASAVPVFTRRLGGTDWVMQSLCVFALWCFSLHVLFISDHMIQSWYSTLGLMSVRDVIASRRNFDAAFYAFKNALGVACVIVFALQMVARIANVIVQLNVHQGRMRGRVWLAVGQRTAVAAGWRGVIGSAIILGIGWLLMTGRLEALYWSFVR